MAIHPALVCRNQPKASIVAQGRAEAAASPYHAVRAIGPPGGIVLHACARPDLLLEIFTQGPMRCTFQHRPDHERLARAVIPDRAGCRSARERRHEAQQVARLAIDLHFQHLAPVRIRVDVRLVPAHTGTHRQQLPDTDAVVGAALQHGDVFHNLVIEACYQAIHQRRARQRRCHRFRHRERCPVRLGSRTQLIVLEGHFSILQDQQTRYAVSGQIIKDVVAVSMIHEQDLWKRLGALRQRSHGPGAMRHADRQQLFSM